MIPKEIIKKIKQIQIYTRKAVNAGFAGQYESVFKGRGMQFDEVREYTPGDDVRDIDWNVTARTGKAHVKRFVEEREMTVMFAVDLSASGDFGSAGKTKNEMAAEFCAVLAFTAAKNNDKVGLLIFTDHAEMYIPAKKGSKHMLRMVRELLYFEPKRAKTNIANAADYLAKVLVKKATVFFISDFIDKGFQKSLQILNRKHDVIAVTTCDKAEIKLPNVGVVEMAEAETSRIMLVDTADENFRNEYAAAANERFRQTKLAMRASGIDCISIQSDKPYIKDLVAFFKMRQRRF